MKTIWTILSLTFFQAGCDSRDRETGLTSPARQQKQPTPASAGFLGLADDKSQKIGDSSPDSALAGMTSVTEVRLSTAAEYDRARADGRIKTQEERDGFIYYAVEEVRHAPFPNGSSAYFTVTERFKVKMPDTR